MSSKKNPLGISIGSVFKLPPSASSEAVGRELFGSVLAGYEKRFDIEAERKSILEKRVRTWVAHEVNGISYVGHPEFGPDPVVLHVMWHDAPDWMPLRVPLQPGERLFGIAVSRSDLSEESRPSAVTFFVDIVLRAFDLLRPEWGCIDAFEGMGYGTPDDPTTRPHWMVLLGAGREAEAERFALSIGGTVLRRPWGGLVVQRPGSPFAPLAGSRRTRKGAATRASPSEPTHVVALAGVEVRRSEAERILRAGGPRSELRSFASASDDVAYVGVPLVVADAMSVPSVEAWDLKEVLNALEVARTSLARLGVRSEVALHIARV